MPPAASPRIVRLLALLGLALLLGLAPGARAADCAFLPDTLELKRPGDDDFRPLGERLVLPASRAVETVSVRLRLPPSDQTCYLLVERVPLLGLRVQLAGESVSQFDFFAPAADAVPSAAGYVTPLPPSAVEQVVVLELSKLGVVSTRVERVSLAALVERERRISLLHGISVFAPGFMLLLVIPFWLRLRDRALFAYMGLLAALMLASASLDGTLYRVPLLNAFSALRSMAHTFLIALFALAVLGFFRAFLGPLDRPARLATRAMSLWFAACAFSSLVWLPAFSVLMQHALSLGLLLLVPLLFVLAWRSWRSGHPSAPYFLVGWMLPLAVLPLRVLTEYGVLEWQFAFRYAPRFAFMLESIVFAVGLADRLLRMRLDRDRAEQARLRSERDLHNWRQLAEADALTGLASRRALEDQLSRWDAEGTAGAVLFLDLDGFKVYNDRFGHAEGDRALREAAQILRQPLADSALAARYGGEELVALLPGVGREAAQALAERLRAAVQAGIRAPDGKPLTVSIGVAERGAGEPARSAVARADAALYRAKAEGRNRVCGAD